MAFSRLIRFLLDDIGIGDYVGDRRYPMVVPIKKEAPFVAWSLSLDAIDAKQNVAKIDAYTVQISVADDDYDNAHEIADWIRTQFEDSYGGETYEGFQINQITFKRMDENFEQGWDHFYITNTFEIKVNKQ